MSIENSKKFIDLLNESLKVNTFVRLAMMNKRNKTSELNTITAKLIQIKDGVKLSVVYRYPTKDITKNYSIDDSLTIVEQLLNTDFLQADLFTLQADYFLAINKKNIVSIREKASSISNPPELAHDKEKNRMIPLVNNIYLRELGITTADWQIRHNMQDKYRQINKYIEIIDGILKSSKLENSFNVVDMGAGKGYLTFALYDYLYNVLHKTPNIIGVELRQELVVYCNQIAQLSSFTNLCFKTGTIKDVELPKTDMLIALHACDTATDDAVFRGIASDAKIIICAPCCHKQLRKQMNPTDDLSLISQFGILKERQAELLTDGIRALLLEAYGYKTKVFEFIATEHTPKNVLIVGLKQKQIKIPCANILQKIENIKRIHGIEYHYLETLLSKL
ncbi:MAG: SAM-dependent methyltransferase [Bacteroidetes bacterium]|nr:SAM-dependent methyltransferase [Bacteroidota bacterium]